MNYIEDLKTIYNLSQDYNLLEQLLYKGYKIPCFVTYDWNNDKEHPIMTTDIALASYHEAVNKHYDRLSVGCRGTGFIDYYPNDEWWNDKRNFNDSCKKYDLWFIIPNEIN